MRVHALTASALVRNSSTGCGYGFVPASTPDIRTFGYGKVANDPMPVHLAKRKISKTLTFFEIWWSLD